MAMTVKKNKRNNLVLANLEAILQTDIVCHGFKTHPLFISENKYQLPMFVHNNRVYFMPNFERGKAIITIDATDTDWRMYANAIKSWYNVCPKKRVYAIKSNHGLFLNTISPKGCSFTENPIQFFSSIKAAESIMNKYKQNKLSIYDNDMATSI
jgi:hypothetical protein